MWAHTSTLFHRPEQRFCTDMDINEGSQDSSWSMCHDPRLHEHLIQLSLIHDPPLRFEIPAGQVAGLPVASCLVTK